MVLDAIGDWAPCRRVLRRGGRVQTIVSGMPRKVTRFGPYLGPACVGFSMARFKVSSVFAGTKVSNVLRTPSAENLAQLTQRIDAGTLRPVVDRTLPLDEIVEAHRYSESGRARGKIVIGVVCGGLRPPQPPP